MRLIEHDPQEHPRSVQLLGLQLQLGRLVLQLLVRELQLELLVLEPGVLLVHGDAGLAERVLRHGPRGHVDMNDGEAGLTRGFVPDRKTIPLGPHRETRPADGAGRVVAHRGKQHRLAGVGALDERQQAGRLELLVGEERVGRRHIGHADAEVSLVRVVADHHPAGRVVHADRQR